MLGRTPLVPHEYDDLNKLTSLYNCINLGYDTFRAANWILALAHVAVVNRSNIIQIVNTVGRRQLDVRIFDCDVTEPRYTVYRELRFAYVTMKIM